MIIIQTDQEENAYVNDYESLSQALRGRKERLEVTRGGTKSGTP